MTRAEARGIVAIPLAVAVLTPGRYRGRMLAAVSTLATMGWIGARISYASYRAEIESRISRVRDLVAEADAAADERAGWLNDSHQATVGFAKELLVITGDVIRWLPPDERGPFQERIQDALARLTEHHPTVES